jgi:hypothetical protein
MSSEYAGNRAEALFKKEEALLGANKAMASTMQTSSPRGKRRHG